MRIGLSLLNFRPGQVGGVETYIRALLRELPALAGGDGLVVVLDRDLAAALPTPGFERVVYGRSGRAVIAERIAEAFTPYRSLGAERAVREMRADVVLYPQQSIFPKRAAPPAVVTAVDLQHLFFPENFPLFDRAFRPAIYPYSERRARLILAISEFTRRTLVERAGVPAGKVVAVPFGYTPTDAAAVAPTDLVPAPYYYYPAATFPHKGHDTLLRSYAALRRRGETAAKLVLTGLRTKRWPALQALARAEGIADDVRHLGFLPYAQIRRVFAGAEAVLFPTRFEGFGIPVLEAVEFGRRVVTSRLEVFDEIGVPPEWQIDFADPDALAAALRRPGPTRLTRQPWTWAGCAGRTLELLRQAARVDAP